MKRQIINLVLALSVLIPQSCTKSREEKPEMPWSKLYGGSLNDFASDMKRTKDGGFAVFGQTMSVDKDVSDNNGDWDFWFVKLNDDGILEWQKTYGGGQFDRANACFQTIDGGYVLTGMTESNDGDVSGNHGSSDVWVIKINSTGDIQWDLVWGGSAPDEASDIIETINGEIILVGYTESGDGDLMGHQANTHDGFILCLNPNGSIKWQKTYGGEGYDGLASIIQASSGKLVAVGFSDSKEGEFSSNHGYYDSWMVMVDLSGNVIWNKTFGGVECELFSSLIQTDEGYFVATGALHNIEFSVVSYDFLVTKVDPSGNLTWSKQFGGSDFDYGLDLIESADKSILIVGRSRSNDGDVLNNHGNEDAWIVKLNKSGEMQWKQTFGGSMDDIGKVVLQNPSGSIIVAGFTESNNGDVSGNKGVCDYWIFKFLNP